MKASKDAATVLGNKTAEAAIKTKEAAANATKAATDATQGTLDKATEEAKKDGN